MKPDAFMPLYGDDFISAVKMLPKDVKWIYLECCWHYWSHTHCEGLPDDDSLLQELSQVQLPDVWRRVKQLVFDNDKFFVLDGGKWHQKRCRELYLTAKEAYAKKVRQTSAARAAVTKTVTGSVTVRKLKPEPELIEDKTNGLRPIAFNGRLSPIQAATATRFASVLGCQWDQGNGRKWMKRCRDERIRAERVISEVENAIKENRVKTTPAQYAEQIWKEFV